MGRGGRSQQHVQDAPAGTRARARTHTITCREHHVVDLQLGVIDDAARLAFSSGQCHAMAAALHERTGWPLHELYDDDGDPIHFYVITPDGRALDINGCYDIEDFQAHWGGDSEPLNSGQLSRSWSGGGMRRPDMLAARSMVGPALEYVDGSRPSHDLGEDGVNADDLMRLADTLHVAAGAGRFVRVTPGVLDDDARDLLRTSQDHALARALRYWNGDGAEHLTGAEMVVLSDGDDAVRHVFVRLADGRALDIDGAHVPGVIEARYGGEARQVNYRALNAYCDDARPQADDQAAQSFIPGLLAALDA